MVALRQVGPESRPDAELVALAHAGDEQAIRALVRRHNQRLFRAARSVLHNDAEAEDVVQASYVKAFTHLDTFRGEASLSTCLTRIALNEALGRVRSRRETVDIDLIESEGATSAQVIQFPLLQPQTNPEVEMARNEVRQLLEQALDRLPPAFRTVFVLREIEGMNVAETAAVIGIPEATVKTRLLRARRLMRESIEAQLGDAFASLFPFDGERCVQMAERVVTQLRGN